MNHFRDFVHKCAFNLQSCGPNALSTSPRENGAFYRKYTLELGFKAPEGPGRCVFSKIQNPLKLLLFWKYPELSNPKSSLSISLTPLIPQFSPAFQCIPEIQTNQNEWILKPKCKKRIRRSNGRCKTSRSENPSEKENSAESTSPEKPR